ncbi:unnamed protein product [Spirodela intermedia]|uniref:Uncharacterized protein n=1 Tax=Spirodela intermedia TaxID=51605 RepID=A0A7I8IDL3_SPIIN|nr:unnamed protein product [Spirodela intermedia]CAA6655749.1 unnamed protein product [Spirodela intermedia]
MLPSLVLALRQDMYEWVTEVLNLQNGTFVFKGPWFTNLHCVVTADPRNLEFMLKTKFSSFPKGEYFRNTVRDLLGDGIFNADDETWRRQRKAASLEFHSAEFRNLTAQSLVELVHSRLLPVLESSRRAGETVDLQDVLLRLTFDNVSILAFGADPGCLSPGYRRSLRPFVTPTGIWKALRYLQLGTERTLRKNILGVDEFAYKVISTRKKELALESDEKKAPRADLLTIFMRLRDDDGEPFSDKFLRDICVNFILAGRDTSSVALAWFFWLLGRNPVEPSSSTAEKDGSPLVFRPEEVKKMEYLQAALSESLRLYPRADGSPSCENPPFSLSSLSLSLNIGGITVARTQLVEDEVFPDGTVLKKGTKVVYAIYTMGRMESIWGKDCREFKPERWIRDGRFASESAYKFTAFNGGPRLCLGKDFAYYQMRFVAASILLRYRVHVVENHPVEPKLALTMFMKRGLKVNLSLREGHPN